MTRMMEMESLSKTTLLLAGAVLLAFLHMFGLTAIVLGLALWVLADSSMAEASVDD